MHELGLLYLSGLSGEGHMLQSASGKGLRGETTFVRFRVLKVILSSLLAECFTGGQFTFLSYVTALEGRLMGEGTRLGGRQVCLTIELCCSAFLLRATLFPTSQVDVTPALNCCPGQKRSWLLLFRVKSKIFLKRNGQMATLMEGFLPLNPDFSHIEFDL